mgnify:CR=1 FL=1
MLYVSDKKQINNNSEYSDFTKAIDVPNRNVNYNVSFDYDIGSTEKVSLVYQLSTVKDSLLLWQSMTLSPKENTFQAHLKLPWQSITDSTLVFKSYLLNETKGKLMFKNLDILIYGE